MSQAQTDPADEHTIRAQREPTGRPGSAIV
jgi:hypothetical protein